MIDGKCNTYMHILYFDKAVMRLTSNSFAKVIPKEFNFVTFYSTPRSQVLEKTEVNIISWIFL